MCTLTWLAEPTGGYTVLFNRDERHARGAEAPPTLGETGGVRWVAPRDSDHGGTWLLLNERGLTLAVLNHYGALGEVGRVAPGSRGRLPLLLGDAASVDAVGERLTAGIASGFAPFHLVALDAHGGRRHWRWDGRSLATGDLAGCVTTSSFESARVAAWRQARYEELGGGLTFERLAAWHRIHRPDMPAESVLMRRVDARTRSVCTVTVGVKTRTLRYAVVSDTAVPQVGEEHGVNL